MLAEALSVLPDLPTPLRAAGFGFTLARITVRPSRTRFAGRLNSGVRPQEQASWDLSLEQLEQLAMQPPRSA